MNCSTLFCVFIFLFGTPVWCQNLCVGTTSAYAPYVSLTNEGEYVGFDIDIAKELCKRLGRELVIKDMGSMPALFLALKLGKVDACIWAISITKERQKQMKMIYYQGEKVTSLPLLFWNKVPANVANIEDLAKDPKHVVCVEAGSFQDSVAARVENLNVKHVDKVMDAILEIKYGKSTATLIDPSLVSGFKAQFPEICEIQTPLQTDEQSFGNGICLNYKNTDLILACEKAVESMQSDGTISALEMKWNLGEK